MTRAVPTADALNLGPKKRAEFGLPTGFEQRLKILKFGKSLTLHLLGRADLLPLKLYAASDEFGRRQEVHFQDLKVLTPTFDELDHGIEWMRALPDFRTKRTELQTVLERLGYDDLALSQRQVHHKSFTYKLLKMHEPAPIPSPL
jgi:hypothetical protein